MTFSIRNLSVLAYANGFTLWHYRAGTEPSAAAAAPGFFTDAADLLRAGDILMISGADGARILCVAPLSAATRAGGVTLAALA